MTITEIENNITKLLKNFSQDDFVFGFLLAYGEPKATITRLKKGDLNQLETKGELTQRKKLFFKVVTTHLHGTIDTLKNETASQKQKPRFIIVTDYETLLAHDTKTMDTLDIDIKDLVKHYDFFLPLAGMEKSVHIDENPADVKASNKLAKLYDEILKNNPTNTHEEVHALNVFLTRLLFCYFAEDSNIFEENIFTDSIASHTQVDGSDVGSYLERLFEVFNTEYDKREANLPQYLKSFPYVNGGLFSGKYPLPKFTTKSRNILIEIGSLDWSEINPDIFGSMIQAVVTPEHRGDMGMHYTSVPNIMKVIQSLFLDELYEEFEKAKGNTKKLNLLHLRLQNLKIFDPACGSGNFLIIVYKELRKLEMLIFKEGGLLISPSIKLTQFYGIELDDFAHEVAILSLWLAEHQMNVLFKREFGTVPPALPLTDGGNIVHGNATRLNWEEVSPKEEEDEIYVLGNPPYLGARLQSKDQKADMKFVFDGKKGFNNLDYIACWFYKGANYIKDFNAKFAFVSTNSITQGEQVAILWPLILDNNLEIFFAYQSFKWTNNAKGNAGVTVVIVGVRNISNESKYLYLNSIKQVVKNINAYLVNADNIMVKRRSKPLSNFPPMSFGNMPNDGGGLILTETEKNEFLQKEPKAEKFIRRYIGSSEFIKGSARWCLWIKDSEFQEALCMSLISSRIEKTKQHRLNSKDKGAQKLANRPHQFRDTNEAKKISLIIPSVSSERRKYIPCGFLQKNEVISNAAQAIYDPETWIMGVVSSYMHMLWVRAVGGRLKTDYRYSKDVIYNTFPFPDITQKQKDEITELVFNILDEREKHSEKTLAQLYDPDKMPQGLKEAHHRLDIAIERCYRKKPFESDEERLEYLFRLYEEMVEKNG
ncbi:DNA methyltransferase [Sulfurovum sp.]|uniref:class I SAM-dependent DNA methyltransferase n=1 Tax=Sulfurovum sp. TaxID=1969726 RepID=UPI0026325EA3|nr:DNA methyltransferase [Sulfurovum sp.]